MPLVVKAGIGRALLSASRSFESIRRIRALPIADKLAVAFCLAAIAFLLSGSLVHLNAARLYVAPLSPLDANEPLISGTGFASDAVYPTTLLPSIKGDLHFYGSWLHSNAPTGSVHSPWYPPVPHLYIFVCGYPNRPGNGLVAEVVTAHSGIVRVPFAPKRDPTEWWRLQEVSLAGIPERLKTRIVAVDGSTTYWLGFSQPFLVDGEDVPRLLKQLLLIVLTTLGCIVYFLSPGLILRQKLIRSSGRYLAFIWIPVPGLLGLALLGLASWIGPHQFAARLISQAGLWLLVLYATYQFIRVPLSSFTTVMERRVLLVILVLAAIAVAKPTYSIGPEGELYGGSISRSLEVGERSDSRMSFATVQLVSLRLRPYSQLARFLHGGWDFSSRGPIAGLAASPIVLASPVQVPATHPDQLWTVFDAEGFAAYRIAMIVIAACSFAAVFGFATLFLSDQWAFLAFLVAVTAPFTIHEMYFTWPKLESAAFVLLCAYLIVRSRYLLSGLVLGVGYLCHPSVLVWLPSLLAFLVLLPLPFDPKTTPLSRKFYFWATSAASLMAGLAFNLLLWRLINRHHFSQDFFLKFVAMAGGGPVVTPGIWLRYRLNSFLNTLVPMNLFIFHRTEPGLHSIYGPSPPVIPFFFQYWNTLPFGVGIAFFFCLFVILFIACRKKLAWVLYVFAVPLVLFTIYMGWPTKGLMRDGLHAWFLGLTIFAVIVWKKYLSHSQRFWRFCSWALLFRGVEILLMLLLPSIWTQSMVVQEPFVLTDVLALLVMICGTGWLCAYTFRFSENLRTRKIQAPEGTE